jgi:hypothetical protein
MSTRLAAVLALAALLGGCAGDRRQPVHPGRSVIAVYTDVDGVSFSADGANYARYTDFLEREENVALSQVQVMNLIDALERQGFFREGAPVMSSKSRSVPPAAFRICVASPGRSKEAVYFCETGSQVPVKYREIFSNLPLAKVPYALDKFLKLNQTCDKQ